eukprot:GHVT01087159.1.p1 GENE.GHVT01087159.1~~GHVT01087159.1.p1  ORF type:complete len:267 (+),score=10.07 GHVT01087159.1:177-977(+)
MRSSSCFLSPPSGFRPTTGMHTHSPLSRLLHGCRLSKCRKFDPLWGGSLFRLFTILLGFSVWRHVVPTSAVESVERLAENPRGVLFAPTISRVGAPEGLVRGHEVHGSLHSGTDQVPASNTTAKPVLDPDEIQIISQHPHDRDCFTEGLGFVDKGLLLESCGLWGASYLHIWDIDAGTSVRKVIASDLIRNEPGWNPSRLFAEGFVVIDDVIYLMDYRQKKFMEISLNDFTYMGSFEFPEHATWKEGWGAAYNGKDTVSTRTLCRF